MMEELREMMRSLMQSQTAREQRFAQIQEQESMMEEERRLRRQDGRLAKGSTGTNSAAEASKILAENRRLMQEQKEEQLRLQREEEEKVRKEEEMCLAEEARLIRLEERKNQIPKRKKGKLLSDFTPPPEETMLHKGKQTPCREAKIFKTLCFWGRGVRKCHGGDLWAHRSRPPLRVVELHCC